MIITDLPRFAQLSRDKMSLEMLLVNIYGHNFSAFTLEANESMFEGLVRLGDGGRYLKHHLIDRRYPIDSDWTLNCYFRYCGDFSPAVLRVVATSRPADIINFLNYCYRYGHWKIAEDLINHDEASGPLFQREVIILTRGKILKIISDLPELPRQALTIFIENWN